MNKQTIPSSASRSTIITRSQRKTLSPLLIASAVLLSGCDALDEYISSGGEQDFTRFAPGVASNDAGSGGSSGGTTGSVPGTSTGGGNTSNDDSSQGNTGQGDSGQSDPASTDTSSNDVNEPSLATTNIVWKPVSEGNGNLVVLTPTNLGTPSISILDSSGRVVENGSYVGHTNGNRATYRFSRAGGSYSSPAFLRVNSELYAVSNTSARYN